MTSRREFLVGAGKAVLLASAASGAVAADGELPNVWTGLRGGDHVEFPSGDPDALELWLYTDRMSYAPGEEVIFFVHCTTPVYAVSIERDGATVEAVLHRDNIEGRRQETPADAYRTGCGWRESFRHQIPASWKSGVYVVTARGTNAAGHEVVGELFSSCGRLVPARPPESPSCCPPPPTSPITIGAAPTITGPGGKTRRNLF